MANDAPLLKRIYLRFRHPKVFLIALCTFIGTMFGLHFFYGVDSDWGGTNLTLSCEASVASAVVTVAAEETIRLLKIVLERLAELHMIAVEIRRIAALTQEQGAVSNKTLRGVLLIAEAQRDMLLDFRALLQSIKDGDDRILRELAREASREPGQ
jgi:hypothetical protein